MLSKEFRLTWKDINFLVKKRQYVSAWSFSFFYFKQYHNLGYNQISVNVPLKFSKKAVFRHQIKRFVIDYVQKNNLDKLKINNSYYKIFIMINKASVSFLQKEIEKLDKKDIISFVQWEFKKSQRIFENKVR